MHAVARNVIYLECVASLQMSRAIRPQISCQEAFVSERYLWLDALHKAHGGVVTAGGKGPTMLVVRDKGGQVYGGYASEPWLKNGKYYGEVIIPLHRSMQFMQHHLRLP